MDKVLNRNECELNAMPGENPPIMASGDPVANQHVLRLSEKHRHELQVGSGLTVETILAMGVYTETDSSVWTRLLGRREESNLGPALVFPFLNPDGSPQDYYQVKPDSLQQYPNGKSAKYLSPSKKPIRAYFPPGTTIEVLSDPSIPLIFTEGIKKAVACNQTGQHAIGLVGVDCWSKPREKDRTGKKIGVRELIDELRSIVWKGRKVPIVYDSDAVVKVSVMRAEYALAEVLIGLGADVYVVRIPAGPNGEKVGIDDYIVAHGPDKFVELIANAQRPTSPSPDESRRKYPAPKNGESYSSVSRLARLFVDKHRTPEPEGFSKLAYYRGEMFVYSGAAYQPWVESDLLAEVTRHCQDVYESDHPYRMHEEAAKEKSVTKLEVTGQTISNVMVNLEGLTHVKSNHADPPFWIEECELSKEYDGKVIISALDGLYTIEQIANRSGPICKPTPSYFSLNALPFEVHGQFNEPTFWLKYLDEWFDGDADSIAGLQEMFGYLLTQDTSAQKVFLIVGPPRSGKGSIAYVLGELIGKLNLASTNFSSLAGDFGLATLVGKQVAIIPDARVGSKTDIARISERLLSISGEDSQTVNRKHKSEITVKLATRFIIMTNETPRLPDSSGALASRFMIFHTPNSWLGKEDPTIKDKLREELSGILQWSAQGYLRLRKNNMKFTQNTAANEHRQELEDLSSPMKAFVRECCRVGPHCEGTTEELFDGWQQWNASQHREYSSKNVFVRDLRSAVPGIKTCQRRSNNRKRGYTGISLKPREEWGEPDPLSQDVTRDNPLHAMENQNQSDKQSSYTDEPMISKECNAPSRVTSCDTSRWVYSNNGGRRTA